MEEKCRNMENIKFIGTVKFQKKNLDEEVHCTAYRCDAMKNFKDINLAGVHGGKRRIMVNPRKARTTNREQSFRKKGKT